MEKDSKIYVAGHTGLVGSEIVKKLSNNGYNNIITVSHSELDLRDKNSTEKYFEENKPDYVIMAAGLVGGILDNSKRPAEFIYDNTMMAYNIVDSSYKNGVKKLLYLGSSCIYPKHCEQPIKEDYLLTGELEQTNIAYAISKISGIVLCNKYNEQYDTKFISLMPTNLYGSINDNYDLNKSHVLPGMIRKFHDAKVQKKEYVELWGTGSPKREFLHVKDMARAIIFCMDNYDDYRQHVNIGTGIDISIKELAELIKDIIGYEGNIVWDATKPDGTPRKLLDVSKINNIGWKYEIDLEYGIKMTYDELVSKHELFKTN